MICVNKLKGFKLMLKARCPGKKKRFRVYYYKLTGNSVNGTISDFTDLHHFAGVETETSSRVGKIMAPGVGIFLWLLTKYGAEVKLPHVSSGGLHSRLWLAVRQRDSDYVLKYARPTMEVDASTQLRSPPLLLCEEPAVGEEFSASPVAVTDVAASQWVSGRRGWWA